MVVADDYASTCILAANHITRNGVCHDARVREREVFRNNATPAVRAKFDCGKHEWGKVYANPSTCQQPDWLALKQIFPLLFFEVLYDSGDLLGAVARADEQRVGSFHDDEVADADSRDKFGR